MPALERCLHIDETIKVLFESLSQLLIFQSASWLLCHLHTSIEVRRGASSKLQPFSWRRFAHWLYHFQALIRQAISSVLLPPQYNIVFSLKAFIRSEGFLVIDVYSRVGGVLCCTL